MKVLSSSEMLARPHLDAAWRPFSSYQTSQLWPALRDPVRRRGLRAVVAARKAAAEALSAETETSSKEEKPKKIPSWVPWDEQALQEQQQALAKVQVCSQASQYCHPSILLLIVLESQHSYSHACCGVRGKHKFWPAGSECTC